MATARPTSTKIENMFGAGAGAVDRMPMFKLCLSRVGEMMFEHMKSQMPAPPRLALQDCRSMTAEDAFDLHGGPTAIAIFSATGWNGLCYMTCDMEAAFVALELLLGADPNEEPVRVERPISNIERRVAAVFFKSVLDHVASAFMMTAETGFEFVSTWSEPDYDEIKPRSAMNVARFTIETAKRKGQIHFLVPDAVLAPVRDALSVMPEKEDAANDPIWEDLVRQEFNRSKVQITAILDEREGTLDEIARLRVGDILQLIATTESLVAVETNAERIMWCALGKSNDVYMLRVEDFVNKQQELMDHILSA